MVVKQKIMLYKSWCSHIKIVIIKTFLTGRGLKIIDASQQESKDLDAKQNLFWLMKAKSKCFRHTVNNKIREEEIISYIRDQRQANVSPNTGF